MIAVVVPPLGLFAAMGLLWDVAFHWYDLVLLAGFYVICAFGTTIGFHPATSRTRASRRARRSKRRSRSSAA